MFWTWLLHCVLMGRTAVEHCMQVRISSTEAKKRCLFVHGNFYFHRRQYHTRKEIGGIDDGSWLGNIYDSDDSIGDFSLTCFEKSCVGRINLWSTGQKYVIETVLGNGQERAAILMKVNKHFVENAADRSSEKKIPSHGAAVKTADAVETQTNSALIVDAFMMYTNETLADYFGSVSGLTAAIHTTVDRVNNILANSAFTHRLNVVSIKRVSNSYTVVGQLPQLLQAHQGFIEPSGDEEYRYGKAAHGEVEEISKWNKVTLIF